MKNTPWQLLEAQKVKAEQLHLKDLFAADPDRFDKFSLQIENILFDYSKNLVTDEIMAGLFALARTIDVEGWRERMFSGGRINITEDRPVLHVALRNRSDDPIYVDGINVMDQVKFELARMKQLTEDVRTGKWRGYSGKRITDVVNIGIGGSNLGPQ
ncbi:MAG: glucose-6-phosphate isomerase, partial [Alphaproteobacteria bacterium]|nr:glucose-6-phosphate isomerase [Alphaproteobacteria bacterium]